MFRIIRALRVFWGRWGLEVSCCGLPVSGEDVELLALI